MLTGIDTVALGSVDRCSLCDACRSDDMAIYHTVSRPCNCISIHSVHPHDLQKMMWNTSSIHPLHFGCSQNWLFSDTFRGFAPLVSMSCWRSSIASRWNKWIDVPGCTTLLRWTKIQTVCFDHALARWLYEFFAASEQTWIRLHKDIKDVFIHFCIFCDVIRDADLIGGIREWLSFLFTCENQLMLALLKEKHFQALGRCTLQWLGQFMRTRCNLESQSLPLSCTTLTQAFIIPSIPLMEVTFLLDVFMVCPYTSAHPPGHLRLCTLGEFHPGKGLWCYEFETRTRSLGKQV